MLSWFFRTETEKKRDNYYDLYKKLENALMEHNKKVAQAEASYSSYIGSVPNLSNFKIPSNDFDPKREELNRKLNKHFSEEEYAWAKALRDDRKVIVDIRPVYEGSSIRPVSFNIRYSIDGEKFKASLKNVYGGE